MTPYVLTTHFREVNERDVAVISSEVTKAPVIPRDLKALVALS